MTPWVGSPRRLATGAVFFILAIAGGQLLPPALPNLPPRTRAAKVGWEPVTNAASYTVYFWTNGGAENSIATNATELIVSNLAGRVVWNFDVTATDTNSVESDRSNVRQWPVASPALSNLVLTVTMACRESDSVAGPWVTNQAVIYCETNPAAASHYWQTVGISISATNF
jgi:hypothetical protein